MAVSCCYIPQQTPPYLTTPAPIVRLLSSYSFSKQASVARSSERQTPAHHEVMRVLCLHGRGSNNEVTTYPKCPSHPQQFHQGHVSKPICPNARLDLPNANRFAGFLQSSNKFRRHVPDPNLRRLHARVPDILVFSTDFAAPIFSPTAILEPSCIELTHALQPLSDPTLTILSGSSSRELSGTLKVRGLDSKPPRHSASSPQPASLGRSPHDTPIGDRSNTNMIS